MRRLLLALTGSLPALPGALLALSGSLAVAGSEPPPPDGAVRRLPPPGSEDWRPVEFPRIERATRYEAVREGGRRALRAESRCAASALALPLDGVDLRETPRLAWSWRVERGLDVADERTRAGDDFAARVYVTFPFQPERRALWERMRRRIAQRLVPAPIPGRALRYVWASRAEPGSEWRSPLGPDVCLLVRRSGKAEASPGAWHREIANVRADFRRVFGEEPPPPQSVAVMSDSDDTCGHAVSLFADLRFLGPGAS